MLWSDYLAHFVAGAFWPMAFRILCREFAATNFKPRFARPRGVGESSALVNVIWGWFNFIIGGVLLRLSFPPLPPPPTITLATLLGVLVMAILLSLHFGRVRNSAPHPWGIACWSGARASLPF